MSFECYMVDIKCCSSLCFTVIDCCESLLVLTCPSAYPDTRATPITNLIIRTGIVLLKAKVLYA